MATKQSRRERGASNNPPTRVLLLMQFCRSQVLFGRRGRNDAREDGNFRRECEKQREQRIG